MPMILYALNPANGYFTHFQRDSLFKTPLWTALDGVGPKAGFLAARYLGFWDTACWHPRLDDTVDVTGVTTIIQPLLLLLVVAGIWHGLRQRHVLAYYGLVVLILMPFGAVFTIGGLARRPFAMVPFLMIFAALGAVETIRRARDSRFRVPVTASVALVCALVVWQNLDGYFRVVANSREQAMYYCEEFTDAVKYMKTLPPDSYVYFASERWTINYETKQYLAPEVRGEDRSTQFGSTAFNEVGFHYQPDRGRPIFVFVGEYKARIEEVQRLYPGGDIISGPSPERESYVAYVPPT
jgi:hypothetical protein